MEEQGLADLAIKKKTDDSLVDKLKVAISKPIVPIKTPNMGGIRG